MINKENILGVDITDATKREVLEYTLKNLENFHKKLYFVTPNPEFLVLARKDSRFKNILNQADLASADGIGLMIAGRFLGKPLKERLTGVELVESLCREVAKSNLAHVEKPITVGFLGGRDGVAEKAAECLAKKYPGLKVAFTGEEWIFGSCGSTFSLNDSLKPCGNTSMVSENMPMSPAVEFCKHDSGEPVKRSFREKSRPSSDVTPSNLADSSKKELSHSNHMPIDVLFVAFGAPKQEFWIDENLGKIPVKIAIGVGGAFDYISSRVPRAPKILRSIGLEWLFRLVVQPWRIKRQLALLEFVYLVIKEKFSKP